MHKLATDAFASPVDSLQSVQWHSVSDSQPKKMLAGGRGFRLVAEDRLLSADAIPRVVSGSLREAGAWPAYRPRPMI